VAGSDGGRRGRVAVLDGRQQDRSASQLLDERGAHPVCGGDERCQVDVSVQRGKVTQVQQREAYDPPTAGCCQLVKGELTVGMLRRLQRL
jgi:hypothetical protein